METRELLDFEARFSSVADDGTVEGTAVTFHRVDSYNTSFDRAAFASLPKRLPMLWSHDPSQVIGSWSAFEVGADGLRVQGKLNLEVQRAREIRAMLEAKDIEGLSISFSSLEEVPKPNGVRHFTKVKLREISLVAMPSVPGARVTKIRGATSAAATEFLMAVRATTAALKG
jgi:HK97 family phage prohead protease